MSRPFSCVWRCGAARVLRAPGPVTVCCDQGARPRQARPSRVGSRDFASEQFGSACGVSAREVPAPPRRVALWGGSPCGVHADVPHRGRRGTSRARPGHSMLRPGGTAATSAALPCGAVRFRFGTVRVGMRRVGARSTRAAPARGVVGRLSVRGTRRRPTPGAARVLRVQGLLLLEILQVLQISRSSILTRQRAL